MPPTQAAKSSLPPVLLRFWMAIVALTLLSVVYSATMKWGFHHGLLYGVTFLDRSEMWFDFTVYHDQFQHLRQPEFWQTWPYPFTYPATLGVVFALLYKLPHALRWYLVALLCAALLGGWRFAEALTRRGVRPVVAYGFVATLLVTSWPLLELFDTLNIEGLLALLLAGTLWAALRERWWLAAVLIGILGAMKLYPMVLLAMLLSRKLYRQLAVSLLVAFGTEQASLAILGPSVPVARSHIAEGMTFMVDHLLFGLLPRTLSLNHSPFQLLKFAVVLLERALHPLGPVREHTLLWMTLLAYLGAVGALGVVLYVIRIRKLPMLAQIVALMVCGVLLPPLSSDYTLIELLLPFALLCLFTVETRGGSGVQAHGLAICFGCFAVLFTVGTFFTWRIPFGAQARTFALAVLLWGALRYGGSWQWEPRRRLDG